MSQNLPSSQEGIRDAPNTLDQYFLEELNSCVYRDVKGFYAKYFGEKPWSAAVEQVVQQVQLKMNNSRWTDFSEIKSQKALLEWLAKFQAMFIGNAQGHYDSRSQQISNCDDQYGANLCLVASNITQPSQLHAGADVRVLGEFSDNVSSSDSEDVLHLCEDAREVFTAQPLRRFLHGFYIRNSIMELWVFDRSGAYSCEQFDIEQRPDLFIKTMASYTMMSDEEVGLNLFIKEDTLGLYTVFGDSDGIEAERLYLEDQAIVAAQYLVGPGTTCYAARRSASTSPEVVVKFVWREDEKHVERDLLELTKERHIWGVVKLFGSQDLESIANLRRGLQFGLPYKFLLPAADQSIISEDDKMAISTSNTRIDEQAFVNRTISCMVTSPLGRPINEFESVLEFLEACRDVVKGHRSLYQDGKILHRGVCTNNVIIAPGDGGGAKGILIDLDAAIDLTNDLTEGQEFGSDGFMAIGVLDGESHTYRHDLESLFYIFLWVAICHGAKSSRYPPETSRLWGWCGTDFRFISQNKTNDMQPEQFMNIIDEFSPLFKHLGGLAKELYQLLFPIREGMLFMGTDSSQQSTDNLYDGMINAFNSSISSQNHK